MRRAEPPPTWQQWLRLLVANSYRKSLCLLFPQAPPYSLIDSAHFIHSCNLCICNLCSRFALFNTVATNTRLVKFVFKLIKFKYYLKFSSSATLAILQVPLATRGQWFSQWVRTFPWLHVSVGQCCSTYELFQSRSWYHLPSRI